MLSAVIGFCAVQLIPWWSTAIPKRVAVDLRCGSSNQRSGHACEASRAHREIRHGSNESTIFLSLKAFPKGGADSESVKWQGRRICEAWCSLGSHPDHCADLCFEAAGPADRTYD